MDREGNNENSCGPLSYSDAGVDIEAGNKAVELIREDVASTLRPEVLSELGGFGALFSGRFEGYDDPVLVSSVDGVGTKLKVAQMLDRHDTIGMDLVAMCVDDIVTCGAEPLFFLDYLAMGKVDPGRWCLPQTMILGVGHYPHDFVSFTTHPQPGLFSHGIFLPPV